MTTNTFTPLETPAGAIVHDERERERENVGEKKVYTVCVCVCVCVCVRERQTDAPKTQVYPYGSKYQTNKHGVALQ